MVHTVTKKIFPMGPAIHVILITVAAAIGINVYQHILEFSHGEYFRAFKSTQVTPSFLSNYASSSLQVGDDHDRIKPRDLASIMVAAGITKKRDMEDAKAIFDIENGGVGAFLATALAQRMVINEDITLVQAMQGDKGKAQTEAGTLLVLATLYSELATSGGKNDAIDTTVEALSARLSGKIEYCPFSAWVCNPFRLFDEKSDTGGQQDIAGTLKSAMKDTFGYYGTQIVENNAILKVCKYIEKKEQIDCNGNNVQLKQLTWFEDEPDRLSEAVFRLSYLMITELYGHESVKKHRFYYKAMRGEIQLIIMVMAAYLGLILLWRFTACKLALSLQSVPLIHLPVLKCGSITTPSQALVDSRGSIDQLINALPLIGLFGTVIGIIGALPNAAAAVSGNGPSIAQDINALFEQLGLAFSTTALAVISVIVLEFFWEHLQGVEKTTLLKTSSEP